MSPDDVTPFSLYAEIYSYSCSNRVIWGCHKLPHESRIILWSALLGFMGKPKTEGFGLLEIVDLSSVIWKLGYDD